MIVRIMEDDQYRLDDSHQAEFEQRDQALMQAVSDSDHAAFHAALASLVAFVRSNGTKVPLDEIIPSDLVVPSDDMSLEEARQTMEESQDGA